MNSRYKWYKGTNGTQGTDGVQGTNGEGTMEYKVQQDHKELTVLKVQQDYKV